MATKCYCENCFRMGLTDEVKPTYTRAYLEECANRDAQARAMKAAKIERVKQESRIPPPMDEGWWNQEGAPTA